MQIVVNSRHANESSIRELASHRLRFALRRLGAWIHRANVDLVDMNGPRGGQDKHCRLELTTRGAGLVVVSAKANDWHSALNKAIARAARLLVRQLKRPLATQRVRTPKAIHGEAEGT